MNFDSKRAWKLALTTFIEALLGSFAANLTMLADAFEGAEWKQILVSVSIGAAAAGFSFLWEGIILPISLGLSNYKDEVTGYKTDTEAAAPAKRKRKPYRRKKHPSGEENERN